MESTNDFIIDNDKTADWAISKIKEAEMERDRLIMLASEQIADLEEQIEEFKKKCNNDTAYLKSRLAVYLDTVKTKETKTQRSYRLISGTLVFKKPSVKIGHDDEKLLKYFEENGDTEYIKIKKSIDWAEFKKHLAIMDDNTIVNTETGEIIEACTVEDVPASFDIKY